MRKYILTWALTLSVGLVAAQNYIGDPEDIEQIKNKIQSFSQYVMNSDYDKIAFAYTEDGKIMPSGPRIIEGHEDIKKRWTLPEGLTTSYHKILPEEIMVLGDHAYDYGYYEGSTTKADGSKSDWKGKYVIVWKKVEGDWKIYLDIWNRVSE